MASAVRKAFHLATLSCMSLFWGTVVLVQCVTSAVTKGRIFFSKKDRTVAPSCTRDPDLGTHRYAQLKGVKLHYVESGPEDGQLMLMLHGFPEFWYSWRHQIREFNKDYRVVAVDLRGYGGSSKPSAVSEYTKDKLANDIRQLIEHLGSKPCVLIGHDWGGSVTWQVTGDFPHLVDKAVVINCPNVFAMLQLLQTDFRQFLKSWYMFFFNLTYFAEWYFRTDDLHLLEAALRGRFGGSHAGAKPGTFTDEDIEAYKHTFNAFGDLTGPMNYYRAALRAVVDKKEKRITVCPLLMIWGTNDVALKTELAEMSRDYARDMTIKYVEGASHWVPEEEPQRVNEYIRGFLHTN